MFFPKKKGLLWLAIFKISCSLVYGQEESYIFRHINTSAGLASDLVSSIIQDNNGFIWVSTGNGIQKYDGYSFTSYHHDPYDPHSISSDNSASLLIDKENNIWIFTSFVGFNIFSPSTGKFMRVSDFKDSSFKNLDYTANACQDEDGNIWLISLNTIGKYDVKKHNLISYDYLLPKDKAGMGKAILCDPRTGNLWIHSYTYGICMLDPKRNLFYYKDHNPEHIPLFNLSKDPGLLFLDKQSNLWINTYSGELYRYNLISNQGHKYSLGRILKHKGNNNGIWVDCMIQDRSGRIWMGARKDGLLEYFPQSDSFRLIPRSRQTLGGLDYTEYLSSIYEDREGNIWIGSDNGISIFNPNQLQFHSVNLPSAANGLNTTPVLSFIQTKENNIWVATYGQGIQVFDDHLAYMTTYGYKSNYGVTIGEPGNKVWAFLKQADGKLFVGCQHAWLTIYDPKYGNSIVSQPIALRNNTIFSMALDSFQNTWFALYGGIAKWDPKKNHFTGYSDLLSYRGNTEKQVFDIFIDGQNIWAATQTRGLQEFNSKSGQFTKIFAPDKNDPTSISDQSVQCITNINDSLLALGTASGGINIFNKHSEKFSHITTREGLPSNNVTSLYFEAPNDLWVACGQGLCKVNLENRKIFHYGLEDGIFNNDFSDCLRFYKTKEGNLLLGYKGGFVRFRPDSIGSTVPPADVQITGFKIYNQPLLVDSFLDKTETVELSHGQNFITLEFASLSFLEPQRTNYYYQLKGVDQDWVNAGQQTFAAYANLSPGPYTFNVKCENRDGISSQKITTLSIVIRPPFWQTWWFKFILFASIALFLYGLYNFRISQLLKLQAMRNEISKDLHDDLGTTLGSINILSEVAKKNMNTGLHDQTISLLTKISENAQEMVEKMSDIVWAINPKNESLGKIIQRLTNFGRITCESKEIELELNADEAAVNQVVTMESIKNIYLIIKEAMNNAIKHSECRHLKVTLKSTAGALKISVVDDGKGFDPLLVRSGNGLFNMESRVKEMKGSISIHSGNKCTVVDLMIPIT